MNDLKHMELVSAALDGELDAADQAALQKLLANSDSARSEYEAMQGLFNFIAQAPDLEPPAELRQNILSKIELPKKKRPLFGLLDLWTNFGRGAPRAAPLGAAFATGALLTIGAYSLPGNMIGNIPPNQVAGTMVSDQVIDSAEFIDRVDIESATVNGRATLRIADGDWVAGFDLEPAGPLRIDVRIQGREEQPLQFAISGPSRLWVAVAPKSEGTPPPVNFIIEENGQTVFTGTLNASEN